MTSPDGNDNPADGRDNWEDSHDKVTTIAPKAGYRIEVTHAGKYWQWRERKRKGKVIYGGKFSELAAERKAAYEENKAAYHARRRSAITTERNRVLQ